MSRGRLPSFRVRSLRPGLILCAVLVGLLGPLAVVHGNAEEVLTNENIISMVKAGFSEGVILAKIHAAQGKFDTSTDALIKLKAEKVPDKVIEAMIAGGAPGSSAPTAAGEPAIAYVSPTGATPLKIVHGEMETSAAPFVGSRQEVVLPAPRAQYRITDKQPAFSTNLAADQWALMRLKPGKNDRNLPMSKNSGWGWGGQTFRQGPDPKYRIALEGGTGPDGHTQIKPKDQLAPGEYGLIAIVHGQPNMVEVFEFGVD